MNNTSGNFAVTYKAMSQVTCILERAREGDPKAAEELLPLVYDELRRLAAHRLAGERQQQTLQPTALVHEAWLKLSGNKNHEWNGRQHFFAAAAARQRKNSGRNTTKKTKRNLSSHEKNPLFANPLRAYLGMHAGHDPTGVLRIGVCSAWNGSTTLPGFLAAHFSPTRFRHAPNDSSF
jgi:hypothetical protein